jgi:hypothetical protein
VHKIKLTKTREITPYLWVHPHDERSHQFQQGRLLMCKPGKFQHGLA